MIEHLDTAEVVRRFNDAFLQHDPAPLPPLVAETCAIENTNPAPNDSRHPGRAACLDVWQPLAASQDTSFEVEGGYESITQPRGRRLRPGLKSRATSRKSLRD